MKEVADGSPTPGQIYSEFMGCSIMKTRLVQAYIKRFNLPAPAPESE